MLKKELLQSLVEHIDESDIHIEQHESSVELKISMLTYHKTTDPGKEPGYIKTVFNTSIQCLPFSEKEWAKIFDEESA